MRQNRSRYAKSGRGYLYDEATSSLGGSPEQNETNLDIDIYEEPHHSTRTQKKHPSTLAIGDVSSPMLTRKMCKTVGLKNYNLDCWHAFCPKMSLRRFMKP